MDRAKVIAAIEAQYQAMNGTFQREMLREAMKRIPDMDLVVLAHEFGIDTDALLAVPS